MRPPIIPVRSTPRQGCIVNIRRQGSERWKWWDLSALQFFSSWSLTLVIPMSNQALYKADVERALWLRSGLSETYKTLRLPIQQHVKRDSQQMFTIATSGVARICCEEGQSWKLGHGAFAADFRAGCSSGSITRPNSFVTDAVLIERAMSCWHYYVAPLYFKINFLRVQRRCPVL